MEKEQLILAKTHDYCASGQPRMAVVMIHGIASDSSAYDELLKYLEGDTAMQDIRLVTFDLLGAGQSLKDDALNYDYAEQTQALRNAISRLELGGLPLILVGHSLGTFIVTRYAAEHPSEVKRLVLISPPVYLEKDFDNPIFAMGIEMFKKSVSERKPEILQEKAFNNSMERIVLDRKNYSVLAGIQVPTTLIYGDEDALIAAHNIPGLVEQSEMLEAVKVHGKHGVSPDKYSAIAKVLGEESNDTEGI